MTRPYKLLLGILGVVASLYLLLLIPDIEGPPPTGAGKQPFLWNQDSFWAELEREFSRSRSAGCPGVRVEADRLFDESRKLLAEMNGQFLDPQHPLFSSLETNLFRLGPLAAACPELLHDYSGLITRTRTAVKRQSERWDLNATPARQTLYRLLFGGRMALEEVMLQAGSQEELPPLMAGDEEPSQTPAVELLGLRLHSGDILVSRGGAPTSALIARGNDYPGSFSHVALLHVDAATGQASVIEAHIECGVTVSPFEVYLKDKKLRIMVLRFRADLLAARTDPMLPHQAAQQSIERARRQHIPYDFALDYTDHRSQFCSEVVSAAYEEVGIKLWRGMTFISSPVVTAWLGSVGTRHFETQEPSDLEYDPQLRVVAEWRDPQTLFKAHVDDAVTDMMIDDAVPGQKLSYSRRVLPFARVSKAYSVALNAFGKVGPVPEGMSAAKALRVQRFRSEHDFIAARLLESAEEFEKKNSYPPPYWELVRLAREAKAGRARE